ncbi:MAG: acyl-CoA desaturase [Bacteroidota bacterium]
MKRRVDNYFKENNISRNANGLMIFKIILYVTSLFGALAVLLFANPPIWGQYLCWAVMGMFAAFSGLGVCHDAIHGSLFKSRRWNKVFSFYFNIIGANDYIWEIMHNKVHHTYTNIDGHDEDLESVPFLRMSPHKKLKPIHRIQHWLAIPVYGLATLSWVFIKDYVKFSQKKIGSWPTPKHPREAWIKLFAGKALYYLLFIVLPVIFVSAPWYHLVLGFLLMHYLEGITLAIVFMLAHVVEDVHYPQPNEKGQITRSWAEHQLFTTANFAADNHFVSFFAGGLNYQVEHHLFPNVCHVHFPAIAKITEETAKEYGLPYYSNRTFLGAIRSHVRLLKRLGREESGFPTGEHPQAAA